MEEGQAYVDEASKRVTSRIAFKVLSWVSFLQGAVSLVVGFMSLTSLDLGLTVFIFFSAIIAFCSGVAWGAVEEMHERLDRIPSP